MLYRILRPLVIIVFKILFRLEAKGVERIPKKGGFILVSNHASYLDPVVLGAACPRELNFMAKEELFRNPLFSWFISTLGSFPVKRNSVDPSAIKEAMRRLKEGKILLLFPEGTRRKGGVSCEAHSGAAFFSAKLGVPVVPAFIKGTQLALPKGANFIRLAKISVCFGKQITIERRMPYKDIAQQIMENIRHLSC